MKAVEQIREFAAELVRAGDDAKKQHGGKQPIAYLANAMISHGRAIGDIANLIPNDQEEYAETVRSLHERLDGKDKSLSDANALLDMQKRQVEELIEIAEGFKAEMAKRDEQIANLSERLHVQARDLDSLNEIIAGLHRTIDRKDSEIKELVTVLDAASLKP